MGNVRAIRHREQKKNLSDWHSDFLSQFFFLNNSETGELLGLHCPFLQCYLVDAGSVCVHAFSLDKSGLVFEEQGFLVCRKVHRETPTHI